jgi:hypothetical protein
LDFERGSDSGLDLTRPVEDSAGQARAFDADRREAACVLEEDGRACGHAHGPPGRSEGAPRPFVRDLVPEKTDVEVQVVGLVVPKLGERASEGPIGQLIDERAVARDPDDLRAEEYEELSAHAHEVAPKRKGARRAAGSHWLPA